MYTGNVSYFVHGAIFDLVDAVYDTVLMVRRLNFLHGRLILLHLILTTQYMVQVVSLCPGTCTAKYVWPYNWEECGLTSQQLSQKKTSLLAMMIPHHLFSVVNIFAIYFGLVELPDAQRIGFVLMFAGAWNYLISSFSRFKKKRIPRHTGCLYILLRTCERIDLSMFWMLLTLYRCSWRRPLRF